MVNDIQVTEGSGKTVATDEVAGKQLQRIRLVLGALGVDDGNVSSTNKLPVTAEILTLPPLPTGSNVIGTVVVSTLPAITGSVTANAGTNLNTSALALESTLSVLNAKVTAVNTGATVLAAGAATVGSILNISGTISLPTGAATSANQTSVLSSLSSILAELAQKTEPGDFQASVAVENGTNALVKAGDDANKAIRVNVVAGGAAGGGVSQADKSAFVEGAGSMNPAGGVFNDTISADPTEDQAAALRITARRGLHVNLRDSAGAELTTFPVTGTVTANLGTIGGVATQTTLAALLTELQLKADLTETQPVSAASLPLPSGASTSANQTSELTKLDSIISALGGTLAVSGTVTANAGTNLNTSALALESGGNLASVLTSLQLIDDAIYATNGAISKSMAIGGQFDDAATTAATENNVAPVRITAQRALHVNLRDAAGSELTGFPISGTVTANIGTTGGLALDTTLAKLTVAQGAALGSNTQALAGGSVTTAAPSYTTGQISPLSLTTAGLLRVDGSGVTQPVSGTVTANAGSGTFAVSGTVTANAGTGTFTVGGTVTANAGTGTFTVGGTVTSNIGTTGGLSLDSTLAKLTVALGAALGSNTQALVGGSVTTAAPTYTTGQISPLSLTTAGLLRVDGSGVTQPISGSVTANLGTIAGVATETTLASLNSKVTAVNTGAVVISSGTVTTVSTVTNLSQLGGAAISMNTGVRDAGTQRVTIATNDVVPSSQSGTWNITNVSGTVSLPTGAATETTQAKTTITQGAALGSNTQTMVGGSVTTAAPTYTTGQISPLSLNTAGGLRVDGSGVTQPVSGTVTANAGSGTFTISGSVTANAGTNLNTSALALEAGGNLAAHTTALQIMDDWDETDRCKVNIIAGQVGVQGGSGTSNALTQRVVLATDIGLPAGVNNIGDVDVLTLPALPAGSNNIGDVDVLTLPALSAGTNNIGDVDVLTLPALPAGTNNIGDVDVLTLPALVAGSANIGDVDVLTLPALPAGANNIGTVVPKPAQTAFDHGRKSAIGTGAAVAITGSSIPATQGVIVKAANSNTGILYVGNSDATADSADGTDGFELGAGESCTVPVDNANKVFVASSAASQKAFFMVA